MDFDVIVLGTGLSESIAAAAISKAGYKVAHIDTNQYYGGDEASLTLEELVEWADTRSSSPNTHDGSSSSNYMTYQRTRFTSISCSRDIIPQSRQYSLSLAPSIVPSIGPHIDSLIASGVSRYGSFRLLEQVALYDRPGFVQTVPGSKEDVFKSKSLSLVDKRRLMRFLMFAAGEFERTQELEGREQMPFMQVLQEVFSLKDRAAAAIAYALAFCTSAEEPTLPALQRIRQYLRSAGRYGASPFLVGHYGGLGETAQGFCRMSAVKGGLYVLGRRVLSVKSTYSTSEKSPDEKPGSTSDAAHLQYTVELEDFTQQVTGKVLVASPAYLPSPTDPSTTCTVVSSIATVARCIAIIGRPVFFTPSEAPKEDAPTDLEDPGEDAEGESHARPTHPDYEVDTAVLVFPPGSLANGSSNMAAHVLITGPGSMSSPKGTRILNISLPLSSTTAPTPTPKDMLRAYLDAVLTLTVPPGASLPQPLFTVFYMHHPDSTTSPPHSTEQGVIITPPCNGLLPTISDAATANAESMFWECVKQLKTAGAQRKSSTDIFTKGVSEGEGEEDVGKEELGEIDSFWPPLDAVEDPETTDDW